MHFTQEDLDRAVAVLETEAQGVLSLKKTLDVTFLKALDVLFTVKGRIIVTGMGKSGQIGKKIAATFASTGSPAFFLHPAEASHGDLGMVTSQDVLFALSLSGETAELDDLIAFSCRFCVPLIAITGGRTSTLARAADIALILPDNTEACPYGLVPTTSTTTTLALGDALAVCLLSKRAFSQEDFKKFHPGGRLGKRLLTVKDLMHTGVDLPLVAGHLSMGQVLPIITQKALGCVGIADNENYLLGVITDGDIRRYMGPDFLNLQAQEVMTKNPFTLSPETFALQALQHMNQRQITNCFIVDENRILRGLLHIHDCLRAGLA
ncbi:MAG: KpsF/GutQ family sugar-phosphate isomerase [Holosporales bacterium]|jgi:arabinose-5-phosphate isomerase|nr:KpsF/GutQ family sugar-phosphate isomerase [Holosporales bacterium]